VRTRVGKGRATYDVGEVGVAAGAELEALLVGAVAEEPAEFLGDEHFAGEAAAATSAAAAPSVAVASGHCFARNWRCMWKEARFRREQSVLVAGWM
jgi:hypothetical protein